MLHVMKVPSLVRLFFLRLQTILLNRWMAWMGCNNRNNQCALACYNFGDWLGSAFASLGDQVTWQSCWLMNAGFLHMLPQWHDVISSYCTEFWLATTENMWHKTLLSAYLNIERFYSRLISTIETDLLKSTSGFCRWNSFWIICSRKKTP